MSLTISLVPGALPQDGDRITNAILRLIAQPTIQLNGSIGSTSLADGSVTTPKFAVGALSADTAGRAVVANGFLTLTMIANGIFTADSSGRAPFANGFVNAALLDDTTRTGVTQYAAGTTTTGVIAVPLGTAPAAYVAGQVVRVKLDTAIAGATDINVNALGAKNLFKNVNQELAPGDGATGEILEFVYDGTNFQLRKPNAVAVVASARNLVAKRNSGTPNTKVDLTADEILLKDANANPYVATTVSVTVDITASGANGIDTGALASSTWYYLWAIYNGTTVAGLFSLSATAPTLPAGYTFKALVGVVRSDASSHFVAFLQQDRTVWINTTSVFTTANAGTTSYTAFTFTSVVPPIGKSARGTMGAGTVNSVRMALAADANGLGAVYHIGVQFGALDGFSTAGSFDIPLATAATLFAKMDGTGNNYQINLSGYRI